VVGIGSNERPPGIAEVLELLRKPAVHAAVCLTGVPMQDRPGFLAALLPRLQEMRSRSGRPHWIVIDEAHHLFPASSQPAPLALPRDLGGVLLVTAHPDRVSPAVVEAVDTVLAAGDRPEETLRPFGKTPPVRLAEGEVLCWSNGQIEPLHLVPGKAQGQRDRRAEGDLPWVP
jgi:hypothetical protein